MITSLIAGAAAFAPTPVAKTETALSATRAVKSAPSGPKKKNITFKAADEEAPEGLIGAIPPVGFFDPAGLAAKFPEKVPYYRELEIMHGRFAQLAIIGFLIPESYAASGAYGDDFLAPTGTALEAFNTDPLWLALTLGVISALETLRLLQTEPGNRVDAGVLSNGLYVTPSPEKLLDYRLKELQHGRLAMLAILGAIAQELVNETPLLVNLQG